MKDFIEGFQKLLPWLAGLQLAPKLVISCIILLAAAFILILIWSPTHPSKEARNISVSLSSNNQRKSNSSETGISTLTVKEIVDQINKSAPFQRDDMAKNYLGIKVNWEGKFWNVDKSLSPMGGSVRVELHPEPKEPLYSIYFEVPLAKYPQFKIAQRGDLIGVSGKIIRCSGPGMNVTLDADEVIFHKKP